MKNKNLIWLGSVLLMLLTGSVMISCNKKFDEPPAITNTSVDTSITNHTISIMALRSKHSIGGLEAITDNSIITGLVSGDDKNGNLYKTITIQDATGGIAIKLDGTNLYVDYPVGRRVYIKCKGLYISDYSYTIQLGIIDNSVPANPTLAGIPSPLFDSYIVKGTLGNTVTPKVVTISQINAVAGLSSGKIVTNDTLQSTLIQVTGVQFAATDTGLIYADTSAAKKAVSRNIRDCIGNKTIIYTSGFANFAGFKVPTGKGVMTAIYTPYKNNPELIIVDTAAVVMTGIRCANTAPISLFTESFPGITNKAVITSTGTSANTWKNIAEVGGVQYVGFVSGSSHLASISSFGAPGSPAVVTSWLISQGITIPAGTTSPYLSFTTVDGYDNGATFQAMISTDYNGSNAPSASTWTVLPATIPTGDPKYGASTPSGTIDLSAYVGKTIYLGWRYDGTSAKTTTYEIGNIKVVGF